MDDARRTGDASVKAGLRAASRIVCVMLGVLVSAALAQKVESQAGADQRIFPQSKPAIEKAVKLIQPSLSGRLPTLEGFAQPGEHSLSRYQRGYYQASVEVSSNGVGKSTVQVRMKLTAWYADPKGSGSGYQALTSNGRIESDILDQLAEKLGGSSAGKETVAAGTTPAGSALPSDTASSAPTLSSRFPRTQTTFSSSLNHESVPPPEAGSVSPKPIADGKGANPLQAEADNLQEILKNTAHPNNLVAVKKSGTPVVATPSLNAKPQFLASLHDEFELLDFNANWVHVRISGLSRGWIWRNNVEMPEGIGDTDTASAKPHAADLYRVVREEAAQFPGDWEPLRSKKVRIVSVQKADDATDAGPSDRLEFAKFLLEKNYKEMARTPQDLMGVVVIFDLSDGGMIAATTSSLQQWVTGKLSDAAMWHQCFFDPPEIVDSAGASGNK